MKKHGIIYIGTLLLVALSFSCYPVIVDGGHTVQKPAPKTKTVFVNYSSFNIYVRPTVDYGDPEYFSSFSLSAGDTRAVYTTHSITAIDCVAGDPSRVNITKVVYQKSGNTYTFMNKSYLSDKRFDGTFESSKYTTNGLEWSRTTHTFNFDGSIRVVLKVKNEWGRFGYSGYQKEEIRELEFEVEDGYYRYRQWDNPTAPWSSGQRYWFNNSSEQNILQLHNWGDAPGNTLYATQQ